MHVVTAGVHYRHRVAVSVNRGVRRRVGQIRKFFDWKGVEIRAQHHRRPGPIFQGSHRTAANLNNVKTQGSQLIDDHPQRPFFLKRQLRVAMQVLIQLLLLTLDGRVMFEDRFDSHGAENDGWDAARLITSAHTTQSTAFIKRSTSSVR